jgi:hypothetical protein
MLETIGVVRIEKNRVDYISILVVAISFPVTQKNYIPYGIVSAKTLHPSFSQPKSEEKIFT